MRVLGIDPGSHRVGLALVDFGKQKPKLNFYDTLEPMSKDWNRYREIQKEVSKLVGMADMIAIEKVFIGRNRNSAVQTGECRGAIFAAIPSWTTPLVEVYPSSVKKAACGNGRADKKEVRRGLEALFGRALPGHDDGVDAIAIALCGEALWRAAELAKRA